MHMADALLSPAVAATMYAATAVTVGTSVKTLRNDENLAKLPTMAVTSALVFAGQMINYTIPGTGSSGHLCGGMMLSALLGPQAGFLSMVVILTIQSLFFADGGLLALGANCWNMAFYGCFVGYYLLWKPIMGSKLFAKLGAKATGRAKIILACVLGCVVTLQLGAFSVVLETTVSGISELPFQAFVGIMQPIHLAIGLVEGLITSAVLVFVYEARPELVMDVASSKGTVLQSSFPSLASRPSQQSFTIRKPSSLTRRCSVRLAPIAEDSPLLPPVGVWAVSQSQCGRSSSQTGY